MVWMALFITLWFGCHLATVICVPWQQLKWFANAPKPRDYYLAAILYHGVALAGIAETIIAPKPCAAMWRVYGALLFLGGQALVIWARRVNPFFVAEIRKPVFVVHVGPYKLCAHPGYLGMTIASFGTVVLLGSLWGYVPMFFYWVLLLNRAEKENQLLREKKLYG